MITTPKDKKITAVRYTSAKVRSSNKAPCLLCSKTCVCEIAAHHERNVNMTAEFFVKDKCLCRRHDQEIDRTYKKEKAKHQLMSGLDFYKAVYYGECLRSAKDDAQFCDHQDKNLLFKRLENLYEDWDSAVLKMEGKEG